MKYFHKYTIIIVFGMILWTIMACHVDIKLTTLVNPVIPVDPSILYQLPNATSKQMMGYVIKTSVGKIIVIDGGTMGDAAQLSRLIKMGRENGNVDAWFITHPHDDHIEALIEIAQNYPEIQIAHIYASFLDLTLIHDFEPGGYDAAESYYSFINNKKDIYTELAVGDSFNFDDVTLEVLSVKNPEIISNFINNSSCCFKVYTKDISVLFLGDLMAPGGHKLLNQYKDTNVLRSDIVQMSHHGHSGVDKDVYEEIAPKVALWPTPKWLWENNVGEGINSGPFNTLEVRAWMDDMGVRSVLGFEGLAMIPLVYIVIQDSNSEF